MPILGGLEHAFPGNFEKFVIKSGGKNVKFWKNFCIIIAFSSCLRYCMIQNFGGRNFWRNSSQQRLANNILMNTQNRGDITKHSLVTRETICHCDITCCITCNVSWSPAWSMCLVWRQWFVAIMNISEPVLNFVWALWVLLVTIIRCWIQKFVYTCIARKKLYLKMVFSH